MMFEKEAEEYIKKNNLEWELECHRTSPIGEVNQAFQKGAEFGYNKGFEFGVKSNEKEKAELKKFKRECETSLCRAEYQYNYEQLTKAKDLLLRFVELKNKPCASGNSVNMLLYDNICAETEQFLNSEVEN